MGQSYNHNFIISKSVPCLINNSFRCYEKLLESFTWLLIDFLYAFLFLSKTAEQMHHQFITLTTNELFWMTFIEKFPPFLSLLITQQMFLVESVCSHPSLCLYYIWGYYGIMLPQCMLPWTLHFSALKQKLFVAESSFLAICTR